jgi:hypothetical protein
MQPLEVTEGIFPKAQVFFPKGRGFLPERIHSQAVLKIVSSIPFPYSTGTAQLNQDVGNK